MYYLGRCVADLPRAFQGLGLGNFVLYRTGVAKGNFYEV